MIRKIFLLSTILVVAASCKKDHFSPVTVTYFVQVADSSIVDITYNSDYFFDSGTNKPVRYVSNGGIWAASHIAYRQEEYHIKVDYISNANPEKDFQVKVIFNDTLTVDSVRYDTVVPEVELKGTVNN